MGKRVTRTTWLPRGVSPGDRDTFTYGCFYARHLLTLLPITFSQLAITGRLR